MPLSSCRQHHQCRALEVSIEDADAGPYQKHDTGCSALPFKAYCCHISTAVKHPVPDRVKPSFVIFDIELFLFKVPEVQAKKMKLMIKFESKVYKLVTMVYNWSPWQGSFVPDRLLHSSQTLRHGVICVLPVVVNYSSLDTISPHMVVGLFLSRVRLPERRTA